jgi:hypothetical protein
MVFGASASGAALADTEQRGRVARGGARDKTHYAANLRHLTKYDNYFANTEKTLSLRGCNVKKKQRV